MPAPRRADRGIEQRRQQCRGIIGGKAAKDRAIGLQRIDERRQRAAGTTAPHRITRQGAAGFAQCRREVRQADLAAAFRQRRQWHQRLGGVAPPRRQRGVARFGLGARCRIGIFAAQAALPLHGGSVDRLADHVEPRRWPHAAQGAVQPPHLGEPGPPVVTGRNERMLEHRQQCDRRKALRQSFDQRLRQRARRGEAQRRTGGIVDGQPPASAMRRDTPRQRTIGRYQRGALPRRFERAAQGEGDDLRLFGRGGRFDDADAGKARRFTGDIAVPAIGGIGGRHRGMHQRRALGRTIERRGDAPVLHIVAPKPQPRQQRLHGVLGVFLAVAAGQFGIGSAAADRRPARLVIVAGIIIEAGQHHQPLRQRQHARQQPHQRRRAAGDAGRHHQPGRRCRLPARQQRIDQRAGAGAAVAAARGIARRRPMGDDQIEKCQRRLPMAGEVAVGTDILQPFGGNFLGEQRIESRPQRIAEPQRLDRAAPGIAPRRHGAHQPRQFEPPLQHRHGGGQGIIAAGEAIEAVVAQIADRRHPRQQQPAFGMPHERIGERAHGAAVGQQDMGARQRQLVTSGAGHQAERQRVDERDVRSN